MWLMTPAERAAAFFGGGEATQAHGAPAAVMDPQVGRQQGVPSGYGALVHHVGPLIQQGLDKPLGVLVSPWGVRPRLLNS